MLFNSTFYYRILSQRKVIVSFLMFWFLYTCLEVYKLQPGVPNYKPDKATDHNSQSKNVRFEPGLGREEKMDNDNSHPRSQKQIQEQQIIRSHSTIIDNPNLVDNIPVNSGEVKRTTSTYLRKLYTKLYNKYSNRVNIIIQQSKINIHKQENIAYGNNNNEENHEVQRLENNKTRMLNVDSNTNNQINNKNVTVQERHNLVFLKVHKAASTTVHNIVMRVALSSNLDVMLPRTANILSETGYIIKPSSLHPYPPNLKFNVICNHIIFNKGQISKYLKNPELTFYIGIVREPFSQFVSAFYYYLNTFKRTTLVNIALDRPDHPIRGFLENPLKHVEARNYAMSVSFINNRMSADFGFPMWKLEEDKQNQKLIERFLKMTTETFNLVMVVDMFDESIVLLRRLLHWTVKDVIYTSTNTLELSKIAQTLHFPWKINMNFTEEDRRLHQLYAPVDHALYNHFKRLLVQTIKEQPGDFMEEVHMFKTILRNVTYFCSNNEYRNKMFPELTVTSNRWTEEFKVSRSDCTLLQMNELDLVAKSRERQVLRYRHEM